MLTPYLRRQLPCGRSPLKYPNRSPIHRRSRGVLWRRGSTTSQFKRPPGGALLSLGLPAINLLGGGTAGDLWRRILSHNRVHSETDRDRNPAPGGQSSPLRLKHPLRLMRHTYDTPVWKHLPLRLYPVLEVNPSEGKKAREISTVKKISDEGLARFIREFKREQGQQGNPFPSRYHQLEYR